MRSTWDSTALSADAVDGAARCAELGGPGRSLEIALLTKQRPAIGRIKITATHHDRLFKIAHLSSQSAGRLAQLNGSFFCFRAAWQGVDDALQVVAVLHGRCDPRGKSSLPAPLKLSLKVKWNSAHSQSSVFVVAPAHGHNARGRLKACLELTSRLPGLAESHRGRGA